MLLPSELLLEVLNFADYNALVTSKFAHSTFLHLINHHSGVLALPHRFKIMVFTAWVTVVDMTANTTWPSLRYERDDPVSVAAVFMVIAALVNQHTVGHLMFSENTWTLPGTRLIFVAAPVLKYAEEVGLYSPAEAPRVIPEPFLPVFQSLHSLRVSTTAAIFEHFDWAFLRLDSARGLRYLKLTVIYFSGSYDAYFQLLHLWLDLPPLPDGAERMFDFRENDFPADFIRGVITMLRNTEKAVAVMLRTKRDGPFMDADDYNTVDGGQNTTRYESKDSDVTLEIDVHLVTVRSKRFAPPIPQNQA